jgi:type I restriction enzyme S subunit
MKEGWDKVAFGEVFELDLDAVDVDASASYPMVGVLSYGRGLFGRPSVSGADTSYRTFYRLHADQLVVSQLFGWEGAIAPVTTDFAGWFVSSQFPTFRPKARLDTGFARWLVRNPNVWEQLKTAAKGMGDRRRTLSPEIFFRVTSLLPPPAEQQRIAGHLDDIETRLTRGQKLREESGTESLALIHSLIHEDNCADVRRVPMHELVTWRSPDVVVSQSKTYTFAGVYSFGRGVFRKEDVSGMDFEYDRLTRLRAGEFTYPKLMAWEGALGIVPPDCDGCHVSPEFPVFSVNESRVLPEILDIHFKTPAVWRDLAALSTGTNLRRRRLNPNAFLGYQFPLPPMKVQQHVRSIASRAAEKRKLQTDAATLERALLPSLLDRIFNHEPVVE